MRDHPGAVYLHASVLTVTRRAEELDRIRGKLNTIVTRTHLFEARAARIILQFCTYFVKITLRSQVPGGPERKLHDIYQA